VNNFINLLEKFGSAREVFRVSSTALLAVGGIGPKTAGRISACDPIRVASGERRKAEEYKVRIVTSSCEEYPRNLKLFSKPPPVLYVAGEIKQQDRFAIAVVGTRRPTPYGKIAAESLAGSLAGRKLTVVSGLARGVDTIAHRAAVNAGGRTIAVLGSGLDRIYPPENRKIFAQVVNAGAVVSQFAFGVEPDKRNFPIRNRIISGLSLGVVVVEAGEKSGASITAYASLDEGREVFAVPGRIDSPQSVGTNRLIQKGAKLVTCADDIVEELLPEVRAFLSEEEKLAPAALSPDEQILLSLMDGGERHVDYLIGKSGLPSGVALGVLLELELKGLIKQLPGRLFARLGL